MPPLLDLEIVHAIGESSAMVVFVINVMGQPGETGDFTVNDHIATLRKQMPNLRVDAAVINNYRPSTEVLEPLESQGIRLTPFDRRLFEPRECRIILRDVIDVEHPKRHDPNKLAAVVIEAWRNFIH